MINTKTDVTNTIQSLTPSRCILPVSSDMKTITELSMYREGRVSSFSTKNKGYYVDVSLAVHFQPVQHESRFLGCTLNDVLALVRNRVRSDGKPRKVQDSSGYCEYISNTTLVFDPN